MARYLEEVKNKSYFNMKKITLLTALAVSALGFSQSLPLDFEVAEDNSFGPFNGAAVGVVADPSGTNNTNVLELIGNGAPFDGAAIGLDTYIDLSDDTNNTITFDFWAPDATTRTHLLKIEGSPSGGPTELTFQSTMMGFQTISVDFGAGLLSDYGTLVLFPDFNNTMTGTYYVDNIDGPNGAVIPVAVTPANAAPVPTYADADVYSIFNDTNGYTDTFNQNYQFGNDAGVVDLGNGTVNVARQFNLGAAGFGAGLNAAIDQSSKNGLRFDYWADANTNEFAMFLIDNVNGTVTEHTYVISDNATVADAPITREQWVTIEVPLSDVGSFDPANFFQYKVDVVTAGTAQTVFIDNILLVNDATFSVGDLATNSFTISPNPATTNWNIRSSKEVINSVRIYDMLGQEVVNLQPGAVTASIDASGLETGIYLAQISSATGTQTTKLIRK